MSRLVSSLLYNPSSLASYFKDFILTLFDRERFKFFPPIKTFSDLSCKVKDTSIYVKKDVARRLSEQVSVALSSLSSAKRKKGLLLVGIQVGGKELRGTQPLYKLQHCTT